MENDKINSSMIEFLDLGENDKAIALVKLVNNGVGLTLSLEHGSDIEIIMRHSESVRFAEMLKKAIRENEKQIIQKIEKMIKAELPNLPLHLKDWAEQHLIAPKQMIFSVNDDGTGEITLWLITDNTGKHDSSSRIVFDEVKGSFGLVMSLRNDIEWFMGIYGGFAETINAI
jgi:hypothetical protein